jgi:hypothetical protein
MAARAHGQLPEVIRDVTAQLTFARSPLTRLRVILQRSTADSPGLVVSPLIPNIEGSIQSVVYSQFRLGLS